MVLIWERGGRGMAPMPPTPGSAIVFRVDAVSSSFDVDIVAFMDFVHFRKKGGIMSESDTSVIIMSESYEPKWKYYTEDRDGDGNRHSACESCVMNVLMKEDTMEFQCGQMHKSKKRREEPPSGYGYMLTDDVEKAERVSNGLPEDHGKQLSTKFNSFIHEYFVDDSCQFFKQFIYLLILSNHYCSKHLNLQHNDGTKTKTGGV